MPFLIYPIAGAIAGFGAGYFTGNTTQKLVLFVGALIVGSWLYNNMKG